MYPWGNDRRFNSYSDYFRKEFGSRVQKISIDAGFTCPNRDGTCGTGGCTFCDNEAFTPSYNGTGMQLEEQIRRGIEFHRTRYRKATRYLAYFQSYSNTYADIEILRDMYDRALEHPDIVGIVIGTRPDCVDEEKLDYFSELNRKCFLVLEYGIESILDRTLERVNRGHDTALSAWAVRETARRGIRAGGHMIIGLPGEKRQDFMDAAGVLSTWPLHSIKFHQLQVIHGTSMAREYKEKPGDFLEFGLEEYLDLMAGIIERLNPAFVVERIAGEVTPGKAVGNGWGLRYDQVLKQFEELLEQRDIWQGKKYKEES
jgi:radical SAM protein (TIGR01212 family)